MLAGLGALGLILAVALGRGPIDAADAAKAEQKRPNVVFLLSDDQTVEEMRYMPQVQRLIGNAGADFKTNMTNWPLCCPSRATMMSGQYAHNHGVLGNGGDLGGFERFDTSRALPVWLQDAGYYTAHIGKLMNGYERSPVRVPPGWSEWHGSKQTYEYYGFELLENGGRVTYGSPDENPDDPADPDSYNTDVYTDKAVEVIERRSPSNQPFYLSVSYLAPHGGGPNRPADEPQTRCEGSAKPPVDRSGDLDATPLPRPPSFNEADATDKPANVADRPPLSGAVISDVTQKYRCRGESVMGVDDGVERVIEALRDSGELENTLVVYTSDNGFFHGEHRIPSGKNEVYEEAVRVPLLIRGPGIPRGAEVSDLTINADITATILDATEAAADLPQDGRTLLPFTRHPDRFHGRELLLEQDGRYVAIRTTRFKLVENDTGEVELYDLRRDPYELTNRHGDPDYAEAEAALAQRLATLRTCAAKSCRTAPALKADIPRPVRRDGGRCTPARNFVFAVDGAARGRVVGIDFSVNGRRVASDASEPFERRLPERALQRRRQTDVEATAELVDGRLLTLHDRVTICR